MALLSCRGLARRPWFEGLSLDLAEGEIVVLAGRTGTGKSLLLRALADLDPLDEGSIRLRGTERADTPPEQWRRRVLYVHQSGVTLPGSVQDNVDRLVSLAPGRTTGDASSLHTPAPPGLAGAADAQRLSGGERQALALHCALLCEPDVLLLDEATSALDPQAAADWEGRVSAYVAKGHAALWVAHDPRLAQRLGARTERFP